MTFSNSIPNGATFVKDLSMFSLQSDEMTALWLNNGLIFTFYITISNSIPNWTTFVKRFFFDLMLNSKSDEMTAVWSNDS